MGEGGGAVGLDEQALRIALGTLKGEVFKAQKGKSEGRKGGRVRASGEVTQPLYMLDDEVSPHT